LGLLAIATDLDARVEDLEGRLVPGLRPLARIAYNYRWSWERDEDGIFASLDPHRWRLAEQNPVRFLAELSRQRQLAAQRDGDLVAAIHRLEARLRAELREPDAPGLDGPVVFCCAEFGIHVSLPVYSGGLGVLAGDLLKEASDRRLPLLGVGLFYRRGYFRQRLDLSGWQQEYWLEHDPEQLPLALVQDADGRPLRLSVTLFDRPLAFQVWCAAVGRVPLLLLDAELPENDRVQRWTTARLYEGNARVRLAQYGLLGLGAARTLEALGIEPALLHLNEGHPALAPLELALRSGRAPEELRDRVVFTTHTPLAAGNETYPPDLFLQAFGDVADRLGERELLALAKSGEDGRVGMSALGMRLAGRRTAVSRAHAETAGALWRPLFPGVRFDHVTNGAHLPTFLSAPLARLFDRYLGDPPRFAAARAIPNDELWAARSAARRALVEYARAKAEQDLLLRGEELEYAQAPAHGLDPDALTLGFARRLAAYKRLNLLFSDPDRLGRILTGERRVQLLVAGKAHPHDEEGKRVLEHVYRLRHQAGAASGRIVFLEDYDLDAARALVAGCDVWINLPRPPLEASGTSGMKATFNGVLQLSVLDGWWAEAYDGANGFAIESDPEADPAAQDAADAERLYTLLEQEVVPLFYERDADGVPQRWCELVKEALATCAGRFTATRMLDEYVERVYRPAAVAQEARR